MSRSPSNYFEKKKKKKTKGDEGKKGYALEQLFRFL